jgi:hypothetical protein
MGIPSPNLSKYGQDWVASSSSKLSLKLVLYLAMDQHFLRLSSQEPQAPFLRDQGFLRFPLSFFGLVHSWLIEAKGPLNFKGSIVTVTVVWRRPDKLTIFYETFFYLQGIRHHSPFFYVQMQLTIFHASQTTCQSIKKSRPNNQSPIIMSSTTVTLKLQTITDSTSLNLGLKLAQHS